MASSDVAVSICELTINMGPAKKMVLIMDEVDGMSGRGLHSFRFQLNLSSAVHRVTQLNPECVPELLKLSPNVNECKPLMSGGDRGGVAELIQCIKLSKVGPLQILLPTSSSQDAVT